MMLTIFLLTVAMAIFLVCWFVRNMCTGVKCTPAIIARKRTTYPDYLETTPWYFSIWPQILNWLLTRFDINWLDRMITPTTCFVTFSTAAGEMELCVDEKTYLAFEEGQEGILSHRGEVFKNFVLRGGG